MKKKPSKTARRASTFVSRAALIMAMGAGVSAAGCSSNDQPGEPAASIASEIRGAWSQVGATAASSGYLPALSSWAANRLDVWVVGNDGLIHHTVKNEGASPTWQGWDNLYPPSDVSFIGTPAVISRAFNQIDVVAAGTNGNLYYAAFNGGWSTWTNLGNAGCSSVASPTLNSWAPTRLDLWVRCGNNAYVAHNYKIGNAAFLGWAAGGNLATPASHGSVIAGPTAISRGNNLIDLAVQTADGKTWVKSYNESTFTWSDWGYWGALPAASSLNLATGTKGELLLFAGTNIWAARYLTVATGPGLWKTVDPNPPTAYGYAALHRAGATTVDLVRSDSSYSYAKWVEDPAANYATIGATPAYEPHAVALSGGSCPAGGRVISDYSEANGGGGRSVTTFDVATQTSNTISMWSLPQPAGGGFIENNGTILRSPGGNLVLLRGYSVGTDSGTIMWRSTDCGGSWQLFGYHTAGSINSAYGQPQVDSPLGGFDFERAYIDSTTGRLYLSVGARGSILNADGTRTKVEGTYVLVSNESVDAVNTLTVPFVAATIPSFGGTASMSVVAHGDRAFVIDCMPYDTVGNRVPRVSWFDRWSPWLIRPATTVGTFGGELSGLAVAWDAGSGHGAVTAQTACSYGPSTWDWGVEGNIALTYWKSYTQGSVVYDVLRASYTTIAADDKQVLRVLKVTIPRDGSAPTVENMFSLGDGYGGASGSVTQATWTEALNGDDGSMALVQWQQNETGRTCGLNNVACAYTPYALVVSDSNVGTPALVGDSTIVSCGGSQIGPCGRPGDVAGGGALVSASTVSFFPVWTPATSVAGSAGVKTALMSMPRLDL